MPQRNGNFRRGLFRLAFFSLATWGFLALGRGRSFEPEPVRYRPLEGESVPGWASAPAPMRRRRRTTARRLAASFAFAVLFFAGASFSAVAGDAVVELLEEDREAMALAEEQGAEEAVTEEAPAAETPAPEPAPAPAPEPAPSGPLAEPAPTDGDLPASPPPAPAPAEQPAAAEAPDASEAPAEQAPAEPAAAADAAAEPQTATVAREPSAEELELAHAPAAPAAPAPALRRAKAAPRSARPAPVRPDRHAHLDPEVAQPGVAATVWLNRTAPDPTPAALRLTPEFASKLARGARGAGVDWALVLGVLRAEGARGRVPVRQTTLAEAADRLARLGASKDAWTAALAYTGRTAGADRSVALARYYRAVGLRALVRGLVAERDALVERVLADPRVDVYAGGRADLEAGRIDVRIVALIAYLAEAHGQVTVSSLFTGHRVYARPGVVSAHMYGAAVDIAALGGQSILGNQEPGSVTEKAVRDILLLPTEMRPRQVISLLGMGGPSFPLADHGDHIHVGY